MLLQTSHNTIIPCSTQLYSSVMTLSMYKQKTMLFRSRDVYNNTFNIFFIPTLFAYSYCSQDYSLTYFLLYIILDMIAIIMLYLQVQNWDKISQYHSKQPVVQPIRIILPNILKFIPKSNELKLQCFDYLNFRA